MYFILNKIHGWGYCLYSNNLLVKLVVLGKTTGDAIMTDKRRGWFVKQSFTDDFVNVMERLIKQYPDKMFEIQGIADNHTDLVQFSKAFFGKSASNVADVSVDSNANVNEKNITQYIYEVGKPLMRLNSLYLMYKWVKKYFNSEKAEKALEKVVSGELFINDLTNFSTSYCFAYDLRNLLFNGMNFFKGNMHIGAPQRSDSFLALMIQTTAYISNQILGASSYPDFFVALDWFYRNEMGENYMKDGTVDENWGKVRNQFQNLIFSLNFPFRGNQSPFTNLSILDMGFLKQLFGDYTYPDGTKANLESVCELSKKFFEYYDEVNGKEGMFTFPVMTLAISLDKDGEYIDPDFVDWAAKANHKKALGNIFQSEPNAFSSCCRLRNEFDSVGGVGYQNSFGVGGTSIGSHRVAGLNLARISLLEKDNPDILQEDLEILHVILRAHRHLIEHRTETGSLPLYSEGWMSLKRQYSTIGFIGAYEYLENKGLNVNTDEGLDKMVSLLKEIEDTCVKWQDNEKKDGHIYNIEQIPGESMAVRLAEIDSLLGYNKKGYKLYSNQYIPLIERASIHDRFRIQGHVDSITSGGAILHVNVDDEKPLTARQFKRLIEQARKSGTKYFAVNYAYSQCESNHYSIGRHEECPICDKKIIQQYTRVVGFITSINSWNKTRREYEYPRRVFYDNGEAVNRSKKEEPLKVGV